MKFIKGLVGAGFGFVVWFFVWFINPFGILGEFPFHYEQGALVIDHPFGLLGMIIGFFVLPFGGAYVTTDKYKNSNRY